MDNFYILSEEAIKKELLEISEWNFCDHYISAKFCFNSFRDAISLINRVAMESEVINHHPAYTHSYKLIEFKLSTHDAGNKVTDLDIKMAKHISSIYREYYISN